LTLHFGLGGSTTVDELRIVWPDGEQDVHKDIRADQSVIYTRKATPPL